MTFHFTSSKSDPFQKLQGQNCRRISGNHHYYSSWLRYFVQGWPLLVINGGIIHINGRKQMGNCNCFLFHPLFFHGVISTYLCLQLVPLGPPSCRYRETKMGFLGLTNQLGNLPMDSPHPAFVQLPTNPPTKTSSPRPTFWLLKKFPYTPGCLRFR